MSALSVKARAKLAPTDFVFPATREYPIQDLNHAKAALLNSQGTPQEATVRAAVKRKYPTVFVNLCNEVRRVIDLAGKDGSTWRHGYIPTNAAAVALKDHHAPGSSSRFSPKPLKAPRAPKDGEARTRVTPATHRGVAGHAIVGYDTKGRKVNVHVPGTLADARVAQSRIHNGKPAFEPFNESPPRRGRLQVGDRVKSEYGSGTVTAHTDRSVTYRLDATGEHLNTVTGTPGYDRIVKQEDAAKRNVAHAVAKSPPRIKPKVYTPDMIRDRHARVSAAVTRWGHSRSDWPKSAVLLLAGLGDPASLAVKQENVKKGKW